MIEDQILKLEKLKKAIAEKGSLLVAYSGGLDSSFLAKVAGDVLGDSALCLILDHEGLPRSELQYAQELARSLGLRCLTVKASLLKRPQVFENPPDRCYHCKKEFCRRLKEVASNENIAWVADGANLSDLQDFRPGLKACEEESIWHPLMEAEMTKEDIRAISREMGLPFWNRPPSACLASRIPYGEEISQQKLARIEEAEEFLRGLGLGTGPMRVRSHGDMARIETCAGDMSGVLALREMIVYRLKGLGFRYVVLDLDGYRSGSMNEAL
ncbi:MAG: ATP-dependent sacrificial sulfur transferase LarE [Methanotrichaceae archaeon]|nr:ATP-dependent sacrificial sulfur transferase LarE [Methanotrichaceae archaeon]